MSPEQVSEVLVSFSLPNWASTQEWDGAAMDLGKTCPMPDAWEGVGSSSGEMFRGFGSLLLVWRPETLALSLVSWFSGLDQLPLLSVPTSFTLPSFTVSHLQLLVSLSAHLLPSYSLAWRDGTRGLGGQDMI